MATAAESQQPLHSSSTSAIAAASPSTASTFDTLASDLTTSLPPSSADAAAMRSAALASTPELAEEERGRSSVEPKQMSATQGAGSGGAGGIFKKVIRAISRDRYGERDRERSASRGSASNGKNGTAVSSTSRGNSGERRGSAIELGLSSTMEEPRGRLAFAPTATTSGGLFTSIRSPSANTAMSSSTSRPPPPSVHFGGRGGVGNVIRSPSRGRVIVLDRSRTREADMYDERTDRGGTESVITEGGSLDEDLASLTTTRRADDAQRSEEYLLAEGEELPSTVLAAQRTVAAAARSRSRGREQVIPTGRGGRGNLRSPSRTPAELEANKIEDAKEREIENKVRKENKGRVIVGGRGGAGNIGRA